MEDKHQKKKRSRAPSVVPDNTEPAQKKRRVSSESDEEVVVVKDGGIQRQKDGDNCVICLENLPLVAYSELPCKHIFCTHCISKWLREENNKCPLCNTETDHYFKGPKRLKKEFVCEGVEKRKGQQIQDDHNLAQHMQRMEYVGGAFHRIRLHLFNRLANIPRLQITQDDPRDRETNQNIVRPPPHPIRNEANPDRARQMNRYLERLRAEHRNRAPPTVEQRVPATNIDVLWDEADEEDEEEAPPIIIERMPRRRMRMRMVRRRRPVTNTFHFTIPIGDMLPIGGGGYRFEPRPIQPVENNQEEGGEEETQNEEREENAENAENEEEEV